MTAPYQNSSSVEDDDYYNDTMFTAVDTSSVMGGGVIANRRDSAITTNNAIDNNLLVPHTSKTAGKTSLFEEPDLIKNKDKEYFENSSGSDKGDATDETDIIESEELDVSDNDESQIYTQGKYGGNNVGNALDETTYESKIEEKTHLDVQPLDINEFFTTKSLSNLQTNTNTATTTTVITTSLKNELVNRVNFDKTWENIGLIGKNDKSENIDSKEMSAVEKEIEAPTTIFTSVIVPEDNNESDESTLRKVKGSITGITSTTTRTTTISENESDGNGNGRFTSNFDNVANLLTTTKATGETSVASRKITATTSTTQQPIQVHTQPTRTHRTQHHGHGGKVLRKHNSRQHRQRLSGHRRHNATLLTSRESVNRFETEFERKHTNSKEGVSTSYEDTDYNRGGTRLYAKSTATSSTTTRDSNIHIVKPEVLPEIIPSTPVSSNSKIFEIKAKTRKLIKRNTHIEAQVQIQPEYLINDVTVNETNALISATSSSTLNLSNTMQAVVTSGDGIVRLDGFAGMLQIFFGIEKPIDVAVFSQPPSAEFVNFLFALLVWCVRYPAVFWTTTKSFASIFSVQMVFSALDIIYGYIGVSNLYKLQIYSEAIPVQNPGLILNGVVTLALYLLSSALVIASSMIMYLYGHGRFAAKMRDRTLITLKSSETWIYFAHCASLCFVLALAVVKAPLLNDLSATYRNNLHCPTFLSGEY